MIPLADLPLTTLAGVRWLAFDVDDTITEHGRLHSRSLAAMERLAAAGIHLAAVTGRPLGWVEIFMHQWPLTVGVGENGAGWFVRGGGEVHAGTYVPHDDALGRARARALAIGAAIAPSIPVPPDGWARRCDVAFDIGETFRADPADVDALDRALVAEGFVTTRSSIHLHAAVADWDKARGLTRALRTAFDDDLGQTREHVIFVGDSPNDAAAFEFFPHSVGVANVREHAHVVWPTYVTTGARSRGFVELADALIAARTSGEAR